LTQIPLVYKRIGTLSGSDKPASRPDVFNYTQEEFSADVFWGESPPTDEYPEIFDDRYVNILCA
jgi:hypothetical protein